MRDVSPVVGIYGRNGEIHDCQHIDEYVNRMISRAFGEEQYKDFDDLIKNMVAFSIAVPNYRICRKYSRNEFDAYKNGRLEECNQVFYWILPEFKDQLPKGVEAYECLTRKDLLRLFADNCTVFYNGYESFGSIFGSFRNLVLKEDNSTDEK